MTEGIVLVAINYAIMIIFKFSIIIWLILYCTEDATQAPKSNLPLDVEYIRLIVVPIIVILLFLILLALGIGIAILCARSFASIQRKKAKREQEERGNVSLDMLDRRSVNNIYPPLGKKNAVFWCSYYLQ